ncbi:hypothetical protein MYCTH_54709 [Thermothelomyces thermophilus ATCC 42464]|uniref:SET domain-containing protein n=1 Tax=Thermothelomyces thermophilus (strain ATCC 42464 / BCRC 31852 / DSM 1799) TaxID=573729 RepID=G2QIF2_THET4|nr:uncharacterized protein MYCTH_54709 [Thermothelomyces thermophilus ATCC 42464]AEO60326.1 hypothetical protein MYCTH_54709 [Thermothelomyces thermophilus ATCC 42464]
MAPGADGNTVYLTEQEVQRIQTTVKENVKKRTELRGHAREPRQAKDAISQATGAALMADMGSMSMDQSKESIPALAVGQPYPPCTAPLKELQPMKLADLTLETHHRGRQLSVKRASPVVTLASRSWTMVQDDAEETERLEIVLHKTLHGKDVLESASTFIIKEPYFTLTEEGEPTLRIDHPSDLVVLHDAGNDQPTLPPDVSPDEIEKRALAHKQKGNTALGKNDLPLAHASYTAGLALAARLPTADLSRDLHRNRAHVNLLLGQFDEARSDALAALIPTREEGGGGAEQQKNEAEAANDDDARVAELNAKCYFRAGTAAYSLARFAEARDLFERQLRLMPQDKGAAANLARYGALAAITYDVRDDRIRVAPVGLERVVVERAVKNPSLIGDLMDLYGDWDGGEAKGVRETEDGPVVDVFRVHDIVARNGFGVDSRDGRGGGGGPGQGGSGGGSGGAAGLWIRAAYFNHSCVPNTEREFIGDLIVVRALRDIAAGEELVQSYDVTGDYEGRREALMTTWGFECNCALCEAERTDDVAVREKRSKLAKEADEFLKTVGTLASKRLAIAKARRLVAAIDETYDDKKYRDLPRLANRLLQQWLSAANRQL